jgi:hypothetical protein
MTPKFHLLANLTIIPIICFNQLFTFACPPTAGKRVVSRAFLPSTTKFLHQRKQQAVLMKIDISKAFDTLSWEFLLEVLRRRGFGIIFRNLICGILRCARTSVMINGERGDPIQMAREVRQGDPISPTLFILAMDTMCKLLYNGLRNTACYRVNSTKLPLLW